MNHLARQTAEATGLSLEVCQELFEKGWSYVTEAKGPSVWVSPSAGLPSYIPHDEPDCDKSCGYQAPHKHGFSCYVTCTQCRAVCHVDCPAHREV